MKHRLSLSSLVLLAVVGACRTHGTTARSEFPDDALLGETSAVEQGRVSAARHAVDQANDASSVAQADRRRAAEAHAMAGEVRDAAMVRVGRAEVVMTRATATGTSQDVDEARQAVARAVAQKELQDATVVLRDKESVHADALAVLATERVATCEARMELTKVMAINTLDRPDAQKPDTKLFEALVRAAEGKENVARTRSQAAQREVEIAAGVVREHELGTSRP